MKEKKIKFIQLTFLNNDEVLINVEMIGHFYYSSTMIQGKEKGCTHICVLTNNNGGMKVQESTHKILELINN
jgi:hypothetical protein